MKDRRPAPPAPIGHNSGIGAEATEDLLRFKVAVGHALRSSNLRALEKLAEVALLFMLSPKGGAHPSLATMGEILGLKDERAVRRVMSGLDEERWDRQDVTGVGTSRRPSQALELQISVAVKEYRNGTFTLGGRKSLRVPLSEVFEINDLASEPPASDAGGPPTSDAGGPPARRAGGRQPPTRRAGGATVAHVDQAVEIATKNDEPPTRRAGGANGRNRQGVDFVAKNAGPPASDAGVTVNRTIPLEIGTRSVNQSTSVSPSSARDGRNDLFGELPLAGGADQSVTVEIDTEWDGRTQRIARTATVADIRVLANRYRITHAEAVELARAVLEDWRAQRFAGGRNWLTHFYANADQRRRAHIEAASAPKPEVSTFRPEFPGHFKVR